MFRYVYALSNYQLRIVRLSFISHVYHFFMMRTFKILSCTFLELCSIVGCAHPSVQLNIRTRPSYLAAAAPLHQYLPISSSAFLSSTSGNPCTALSSCELSWSRLHTGVRSCGISHSIAWVSVPH